MYQLLIAHQADCRANLFSRGPSEWQDFGAGGHRAHWLMLVSGWASLWPHTQPVGHCWWGIRRRTSPAPAKCWGCSHVTPWSPTKKRVMEQKELTNHENMCLLFFKDTHSWVKYTKISWNLCKAPASVSLTHCTQVASRAKLRHPGENTNNASMSSVFLTVNHLIILCFWNGKWLL